MAVNPAPILQATHLHYSYVPDQFALRDVSLAINPASIVYLLGHNGCGKTTLLEILSGVRAPQTGDVRLNGTDIHQLAAHRRAQRIGLVPQLHQPVFAYTVFDIVMMGRAPYLGWLGTPDRADRKIVKESLEMVGMSAFHDRVYTDLSGGERQLTLIARGLAQQTDVLLLDEPAAHLDPHNQHLVLETVTQLANERVAFVISSHDPNSALLYADQVVVMSAGQVVANGTPAQVLTESILSESYNMPVEVIYNQDQQARAILPRRNGAF